MIYLIIAIAAMSLIMLSLKFFNIKGIYIPQVIMVNYAFALCISLIKGHDTITANKIAEVFTNGWWYLALVTGSLYFLSMDLMAISTRRVGVAVTTMASRTSVLLPIIWAFLFLGEKITIWEILGTALVLTAFTLIIYRPREKTAADNANRKENIISILMPIGVFLEVGFIAVCMKTAQHMIKNSGDYATDYPAFESMLFAAALSCAVIFYGIKEKSKAFRFNLKSGAGGLCLGTFNYFVTFGLMNGLKYFSASTFYGVYNISVVLLTALVGVMIFSEKLDGRKMAGVFFAIGAIIVLGFFGQSL